MQKVQITFMKEGICAYISHLDMIRVFARAMARSNLPVKYTQGFNPIAYLVFSQPLSLGYESKCDVCEFTLEEFLPYEEIVSRLNDTLPDGISVIRAVEPVNQIGKIAFSEYTIYMTMSQECDEGMVKAIEDVFKRDEITLLKKSKKALKEVNILPLIVEINVKKSNKCNINITTIVKSSGSENLNPEYLLRAIREYCPKISIISTRIVRESLFLEDMSKF